MKCAESVCIYLPLCYWGKFPYHYIVTWNYGDMRFMRTLGLYLNVMIFGWTDSIICSQKWLGIEKGCVNMLWSVPRIWFVDTHKCLYVWYSPAYFITRLLSWPKYSYWNRQLSKSEFSNVLLPYQNISHLKMIILCIMPGLMVTALKPRQVISNYYYIIMSSLIGGTHNQNYPWIPLLIITTSMVPGIFPLIL